MGQSVGTASIRPAAPTVPAPAAVRSVYCRAGTALANLFAEIVQELAAISSAIVVILRDVYLVEGCANAAPSLTVCAHCSMMEPAGSIRH
ncbi:MULTISPECIES: hypothetical protein [Micrococcaceae]|uniref:hypothetical protein n=1 Tax=Micrococcaceae TaxID=1268 RepID=UPI0011B019E3|nr:hypothetical protein [Arthrobacter sp. N199823]